MMAKKGRVHLGTIRDCYELKHIEKGINDVLTIILSGTQQFMDSFDGRDVCHSIDF